MVGRSRPAPDARPEYRPRLGHRAPTPRTAWVCARHRDEAGAHGAIPELPYAAVPPAGLAASDERECGPPWKSKRATAGDAGEPPACPYPNAETATATAKPFLLREKTKSAGGGAGDNDCAPPASSNRTDHNGAASDKTSAAEAKVTAGMGHVAAATIEIHPGQPDPGFPTQLHPDPSQSARAGRFPSANLHFDTLVECH